MLLQFFIVCMFLLAQLTHKMLSLVVNSQYSFYVFPPSHFEIAIFAISGENFKVGEGKFSPITFFLKLAYCSRPVKRACSLLSPFQSERALNLNVLRPSPYGAQLY